MQWSRQFAFFRYTCNLCHYGVEKRSRLIAHMAIDHNISVKVVDKRLVSEQPGSVSVYSNEQDPDLKKFADAIVRLENQVSRDEPLYGLGETSKQSGSSEPPS